MILATWNVNSVRARIGVVERWLRRRKPTVLCMQETKVQDDLFPAEVFEDLGYHLVLNGQKTWNGVALASLAEPDDVTTGLPTGFLAEQKRIITATVSGFRISCVYVPNGGEVGSERFRDKLAFLEQLVEMADVEGGGLPYVMAGDFNVAPGDDDVFDPALLEGAVCFHPEERSRMRGLVASGLTDLFRSFNPAGKAYSWWDYREAGFRRDRGMRLDHVLAGREAAALCEGCAVDREPRSWEKPSDHTPVVAVFRDPGE
jgi:exodeoxyribonuclease-3